MTTLRTGAEADSRQSSTEARRTHLTGRISRRSAISILGGLGAAGLSLALLRLGGAVVQPSRRFPDWVYTMPRGGEAYAAAYSDLTLMETLPCFCGCMAFEDPHKSLRSCFEQPSGEVEPHGAFCETCQDEAIDAVALSSQGVPPAEIHDKIVAKYSDRDPSFGGAGCGAAAHPDGEGAACEP